MNNLEELYLSTYFLTVFKHLREDSVFKSFICLIKTILKSDNIEENIESFCSFVCGLKSNSCGDFSEYLKNLVLKNKNFYNDETQIQKELNIINNLSKVQFQDLKEKIIRKFSLKAKLFENLPEFINSGFDLSLSDFRDEVFVDDVFEKNRAFIFDIDFEIKPIEFQENIRFSNLISYKEQKQVLYENTNALLMGCKVNNILLYGDAGCGKSTSVRALLNEFETIKIVQIFKNNLINLDKLYSKLSSLPYKFIIFADDISFDETDTAFSTMKAVLEGSLIQCPKNAVIYATSNRRHLVKESFQSRQGDEIHLRDTINEVSSLSERFGINLLFSKPTNDEFIEIVLGLAKDNDIQMDEKTLIEKAQRLALIKGSKSPRVARQLIDNLVAHVCI